MGAMEIITRRDPRSASDRATIRIVHCASPPCSTRSVIATSVHLEGVASGARNGQPQSALSERRGMSYLSDQNQGDSQKEATPCNSGKGPSPRFDRTTGLEREPLHNRSVH